MHDSSDAIVVGGGLGGLVTAALLARRGLRVEVLEGAGELGGRAATTSSGGYHLNLGGHALYAGVAKRTLAELGVPLPGGRPSAHRMRLVAGGDHHRLGVADLAALRTYTDVVRGPSPRRAATTVEAWLAATARGARARSFMRALTHVATFSADDETQSADVAVGQLRAALLGVRYLDGGWQPLSDALASGIAATGGTVKTASRVTRVVPLERPAGGAEVVDSDGRTRRASTVVLAVGGPEVVARLLSGPAAEVASAWVSTARRVGVTAMDLALDRPLRRPLAMALDRPVFVTAQSHAARLAPPGGAVVHGLRYHDRAGERGGGNADAHVADIEGVLDAVDPTWRDAVVDRRVLPDVTATSWLPTPATGGLSGRPGPSVGSAEGLFVVGDWVGPEAHLTDAVVASARRVVALLDHRGGRQARPTEGVSANA